MNLKNILISIVSFAPLFLGAQNFQIQNQYGFGTTDWDYVYSVIETTDGGFLFCARTDADVSGDKTTANFGGLDIWLIKTNSNGTILWQKSFGGSSNDGGFQLLQTMDGKYIVSGFSASAVSGNKTTPTFGGGDIWIIKVNTSGNIIWQKTYGGNWLEFINRVTEQPNGDLIYVGNTASAHLTGNRIAPLKGSSSLWVLHLDSSGTLKNEFCFGGSLDNFGSSAHRISINSYLFVGGSTSPISLDKSEQSYGDNDIWIIKSDTNGNITQDKTIGGNKNDASKGAIVDDSNNIIIISESESSVSGNKTASKIGGKDLWIVKIDTNLNIIWDKTFGGLLDEISDFGRAIYSSQHQMTIISSSSESPQIGDKTSESFGGFDYWVIGIDNQGNKVLEISLGGTEDDKAFDIIETSTGELLILGQSESGISGNKTVANKGASDAWFLKLDITTSINEIEKKEINAYPIPASTILNFSVPLKENKVTAELVDINGRTVLSQVINNSDKGQFNVTSLITGTYFLKLTGSNFSYSRMVVIE